MDGTLCTDVAIMIKIAVVFMLYISKYLLNKLQNMNSVVNRWS